MRKGDRVRVVRAIGPAAERMIGAEVVVWALGSVEAGAVYVADPDAPGEPIALLWREELDLVEP